MTIMTRLGMHTIDPDKVIRFPRGLIGFEERTAFTLLQISPGAPFLVLQSMDDPGLGLLVADPYAFIPDFRIHVGNAEQYVLEASHPEQIAVLVTASIPHGKPELATLNLIGPILINHERRLGLQVPQSDSNLPPRWKIRQDENPGTPDRASGLKAIRQRLQQAAGSAAATAGPAGNADPE